MLICDTCVGIVVLIFVLLLEIEMRSWAQLCRGRPLQHSWAELQEGGGGILDNGQLGRFYSPRKTVKSVQILGPSSGGVPIAVCKFCGAGTHWSRDLALSQ